MVVYECGNFSEAPNPPETCRYCGAERRDQQDKRVGSTIVVDCPGWYEDD